MRNKVIAALVAGGLLVGAGFVTTVVSAPGTATAQEEAAGPESEGIIPRALGFLAEVLDELVGAGTIEQSDADAVLSAVEAKAEEVKAEREALRELIKTFLEDEVITEEEAAQLPEDHPFFGEEFDEAWEDGQLTVEEIRELRPHPRRNAFKRGARLGALLDDGGIDQAEYDELSEEHPLKQIDVSDYFADDGLITPDELREIHEQFKADRAADQDA